MYDYQYRKTWCSSGEKGWYRHTWAVKDVDICIRLWIDEIPDSDRMTGGVEMHWGYKPSWSQDDECCLHGRPCWHDWPSTAAKSFITYLQDSVEMPHEMFFTRLTNIMEDKR